MRRQDTKQQPTVTIRIERGPVLSAQKTAWKRFWKNLLAKVQEEVKNG